MLFMTAFRRAGCPLQSIEEDLRLLLKRGDLIIGPFVILRDETDRGAGSCGKDQNKEEYQKRLPEGYVSYKHWICPSRF
jgi:hypothetical protein